MESAENSIVNLAEELSKLRAKLDSQSAEFRADIETVKNENKWLLASNQVLMAKFGEMQAKELMAEQTAKILDAKVTELTAQLEEKLMSKTFEMIEEQGRMQVKLDNLSAENGQFRTEIEAVKTENKLLLSKLETVEQKLKVAELEVKLANEQMAKFVETKVAELNGQLAERLNKMPEKERKLETELDAKRHLIRALIDGLENHLDSPEIVRICCSSLYQFDMQDILFVYGRLAKLVAIALEKYNSDTVIQEEMILLLDDMVCQVGNEQRIEMGETGAIEIMLQQISRVFQIDTCDEMMEVGWSFLWNVTYEIPANCERFLKAKGLALFSRCYTKFADRNQRLVRNMMGPIWKIAEMPQLRGQLMTNEYLEIFCTLLDGDIEVSFMSAGTLANLISDDDEEHWIKSGVILSKDRVSQLIVQAIENWDLQTPLSINYDSLQPVIRLLPLWHAVGSQHWAVWTLANLTTTDMKQKYCRLITEEGGMELLEQIKTDYRSTDGIRQLADIVLKNVEDWKNQELNDF